MYRVEIGPARRRTLALATALAAAVFSALVLSAFAVGGVRFAAAQEAEADFTPGAVFGMSNEVDGNEVVAFDRGTDDRPEPGGTGSGTIEDMANSLILANRSGESSPNNLRGSARFLFATNPGSDSISVFRVGPDGLELVDVEPSNGQRPTSVTVSKGVVYVMNSGGFMWTFKRLEKELS